MPIISHLGKWLNLNFSEFYFFTTNQFLTGKYVYQRKPAPFISNLDGCHVTRADRAPKNAETFSGDFEGTMEVRER